MKLLHTVPLWWHFLLTLSKQDELCGPLTSRIVYLHLGEQGDFVLQNQTWLSKDVLGCNTGLVTCPSCSIQITVEYLNLPQTCNDTLTLNNETSEQCQCGGLMIWEPTSDEPPVGLCSVTTYTTFTSSTNSVGISLYFVPVNWTGTFLIHFIAQKNQDIINGTIGHQGYLSSPNFPSPYPSAFGIEHILSCATDNCVVTLLFTDFLVSTSSTMEFYDWDGRRIGIVSELLARPEPIISTGPSLSIRFFANGATAVGYKANYHFIHNSTDVINITTECGGEVDNLGGTIYMSGVSGYCDCVWIIRPTISISHYKTHVYLKFIQYPGGEMSLHQGQTSEDRLLETFTDHHFRSSEHVSPATKGFYIAYKGNLQPENKLVIAYSAFAYIDCQSGTDFQCNNKRCISSTLMCDSFDHCGDNSDEVNCKSEVFPKPRAQYWWPYRSNGMRSDPNPGSAVLALGAALTGSAVLLAVTLCRVALRMRSPPTSHAPHHMDHIRTIAHLLNIGELDDRDEPPTYEAPPEYSQVVKPARPRRKHSAQRLIDRETPTQMEGVMDEENNTQTLEKKSQLLDIPFNETADTLENEIVRLTDTTSQPVSIETTGYSEDLGMSLTLSATSQKGIDQNPNKQLFPSPPKYVENQKIQTSNSVLSFDTLYSSDQEFPTLSQSGNLIKSHSQDNMLKLSEETSNAFRNQALNVDFKPFSPMKKISLDDGDSAVGNCFSSDFPSTSGSRNCHAGSDTTTQ